jgi:hypothetical protein
MEVQNEIGEAKKEILEVRKEGVVEAASPLLHEDDVGESFFGAEDTGVTTIPPLEEYFGESESGRRERVRLGSRIVQRGDRQVQQLQSQHPMTSWSISISAQPSAIYYQFNDGPQQISFETSDRSITDRNWEETELTLYYDDDHSVVVPSKPCTAPIKILSHLVDGNVILFNLKINEISKNHRSREFCIRLSYGGDTLYSNGFRVKTKRTKRKRQVEEVQSDQDFRRLACDVLSQLQWHITGYTTCCEGFANFERPIRTCLICNSLQAHGHTSSCMLSILMVESDRLS